MLNSMSCNQCCDEYYSSDTIIIQIRSLNTLQEKLSLSILPLSSYFLLPHLQPTALEELGRGIGRICQFKESETRADSSEVRTMAICILKCL